jgi:hypothetical protein
MRLPRYLKFVPTARSKHISRPVHAKHDATQSCEYPRPAEPDRVFVYETTLINSQKFFYLFTHTARDP